ncbi:MAG: cobyric acid synthase CobQ [Acidimicrobiales bacterium]|nr:cobyric acid synthase CobQ [Acidimicrobiales bacterium]
MVCGTASDVGKSVIVAGLCRVLVRQGVAVAPFKAQNMSLNAAVTADGSEIGRAQALQAVAAGIEPEAVMNPILLKPTGERSSQVVVLGRALGELEAAEYHRAKEGLWDVVLDSLADLRRRFDVVLLEGAGGAAEINLLDRDLVNLPLAARAGVPAIVVGDIDRGGVFASLFGTVALLPDDLRSCVRGFVVNKLRGDPALLGDATADLERRCGVPTLGVLPHLAGITIDAEDSLSLDQPPPQRPGAEVDVAVVRFPRISNFTDLDPLVHEPAVQVRFVSARRELGRPDLVVLPGSKATVDDLRWLRGTGLDQAIAESGARVLGICGGFQMMGRAIHDDVESGAGMVAGLGWLDIETTFHPEKVTAGRRGTALGHAVTGYEIHHGRVGRGEAVPWLTLDGEDEGATDGGRHWGTSLHGLFEADAFRAAFLGIAQGASFAAAREHQLDAMADLLEAHLDLAAVEALINSAAPTTAAGTPVG